MVDNDSGPDLGDLFRTSYAPLVRALTIAHGDAAVDAVQDAFAEAFRRWRKVRSYDDPAAWIRRVAVNRLLNLHRNNARRRSRDLAHADLVEPPSIARVTVSDALRKLPLQQRIAVTLHYIADLTVVEVADAMNLAPGTVKSHLHDARAALRTLLETADDS